MSSAGELQAGDIDHERSEGHGVTNRGGLCRFQDGKRLDVSCMREHVEHACGAQPEPVFVDH